MRDFLILFVHVIVTLARLARPGGLRSVVAESALVRHQLLVLNRGSVRGLPPLLVGFTAVTGFQSCALLISLVNAFDLCEELRYALRAFPALSLREHENGIPRCKVYSLWNRVPGREDRRQFPGSSLSAFEFPRILHLSQLQRHKRLHP